MTFLRHRICYQASLPSSRFSVLLCVFRVKCVTMVYAQQVKSRPWAPSRGDLTREFLEGNATPRQYLEEIHQKQIPYNGYTLVVADILSDEVAYLSNRDSTGPRNLTSGIYGLSNALLDSPWPKVELGKERLAAMVAESGGAELSAADIIHLVLGDTTPVDDSNLPQTGLPKDIERRMCTAFVDTALAEKPYATSTQTVMMVRRDGVVEWHERFLNPPVVRASGGTSPPSALLPLQHQEAAHLKIGQHIITTAAMPH
mmetsp:Transcript_39929/g.86896  ORF Transcript_39929/g.86896 Transcript_39929/m.86896 type:complete len:257 (-) Transcript_39929:164-934(-)